MSGILDLASGALAMADGATFVSIAVFVVVFAAVFAVGLRFLSGSKGSDPDSRRPHAGVRVALINAEPLRRAPSQLDADRSAQSTGSRSDFRRVMGRVHNGLSLLIVGVLLAATIGSYLVSNPSDGSLLFPIVLGIVTLIAGLHLHNRARRYAPVDREVQADLLRTIQDDFASKLDAAIRDNVDIRWDSSPEVHRIDEQTLARARAMADDGRDIDEICREVDPEYEQWSSPHQQAFQGLIRAALEHS